MAKDSEEVKSKKSQELKTNESVELKPLADKKVENERKYSYFNLFRFATKFDYVIIALATIISMANGVIMPLMTIIFGEITGVFIALSFLYPGKTPVPEDYKQQFDKDVTKYVLYFVGLGAISFVLSYFLMCLWMITGERQSKKIRQAYFEGILKQDIAWFDEQKAGDLTTRISGDCQLIQDGISEKIGLTMQYFVTFIAGFVIAFVKGWRLALVLCSVFPLIVISGGLMSYALSGKSKKGQTAYASAGALAEQVISSIRTVFAFSGQSRECQEYRKLLNGAQKEEERKSMITGIGFGTIMFLLFCTYALAFWYGSVLKEQGYMGGDEVLNVFFAIIIGAFSLGNAAPHVSAFGIALGACQKVFSVLDRTPSIKDDTGKSIEIEGNIKIDNISFEYPSRSDVPILTGFSLDIAKGSTVALVGTSGSGKSSIIRLLQRFYDPSKGTILIDGNDIKELNLKHLRSQVGIVSQEPMLFSTSIYENIALGKKGATIEEVEEACKKANAHDFISKLPQKYETQVGEKGVMLSGGQKQRIAIARAIISNPKVLLLDEATSALDTQSEKIVQNALDAASKGRTTVVVAHRLSTIKNSDKIVVIHKGVIQEVGTHDELLAKGGMYATLVEAQNLKVGDITAKPLSPSLQEEKKGLLTVDEVNGEVKVYTSEEKVSDGAKEVKKKKKVKAPIGRVFRENSKERWFILIGSLAALVNGSIMPLFSILFSGILDIYSKPNDEMRAGANLIAGLFVALAVASFLANFLQISMFGISGERLTQRLRYQTFESMMKQEIAWYDRKDNAPGQLVSKLAVEANLVRGLAGSLMGTIIQSIVNLVAGLVIAFVNGWLLTIVILAALPVTAIAGFLQMKALSGFGGKVKKAYEEASQTACESVSAIRLVVTLNLQDHFATSYREQLAVPYKLGIRKAFLSSIGYGLSQALMFWAYSLAYYYGSRLLLDRTYDYLQMLRVIFAIIFTAMAAGQLSSFAPDYSKAKEGAIAIYEVIDRKSPMVEGNEKLGEGRGKVAFDKVSFQYESRSVKILDDLEIFVPEGKSVALVGPSGCGKSTTISLIERFYDPASGAVQLDEQNVKSLPFNALRGSVSLVQQEPILFDRTIAENILYGNPDASMEAMIEAAKSANIHEFIESLPDKYESNCGASGSKLSGGQKQRIAIARALIRNPKVLLLDEATSALDTESERVVQHALENAMIGRSTLTIAHRLSTIQNCDLIYVLKDGRVVEQGKHGELVELKGLYYTLVQHQKLIST